MLSRRMIYLLVVCLGVVALATSFALASTFQEATVGRGARLFVTKCFPAHSRLSQEDLYQLRDAGFTAVVNKWQEDLPTYCARAAQAGLDVMTWNGGLPAAPDERDRWIGRSGKPLRYARPGSAYSWEQIGNLLVEQAELSLEHPNFKGAICDFEVYDENKRDVAGFSESYDEATFAGFFASLGIAVPQPLPAPDERRKYLADKQIIALYTAYNEELVLEQVREMRERIDAINPGFQVGIYGWGCLQMPTLRGVATEPAPALFIHAGTYGRTRWQSGIGYQPDFPDRLGLKQNLIGNYQRAMSGREADFPLIMLAGHYPQAAGPPDGTQYKFTVRDSFNSVAAADGYWIWTDWRVPEGFAGSKQDWIDAMMVYWAEANAALDRGDWTWAARQPIQVANPEATDPACVVTVRGPDQGGEIVIWEPMTGFEVSSFGVDGDDPNVAVACGEVMEKVEGDEIVVLRASGNVVIYEPGTEQIGGGFATERLEDQPADRVSVLGGSILVGRFGSERSDEYDAAGQRVGTILFPAPSGLLNGDSGRPVAVEVVGSQVRLQDFDSGELLGSIVVGHGLRAVAIADVDSIAGSELITLNAGWVRYWDYPSGAPLLRFWVGHDCVDMAMGNFVLPESR